MVRELVRQTCEAFEINILVTQVRDDLCRSSANISFATKR